MVGCVKWWLTGGSVGFCEVVVVIVVYCSGYIILLCCLCYFIVLKTKIKQLMLDIL